MGVRDEAMGIAFVEVKIVFGIKDNRGNQASRHSPSFHCREIFPLFPSTDLFLR